MAAAMERTFWRGIEVDHPLQWEVAVASGPDDPGRLTFADRRFHRFDLRWRSLKYVPNMDLMLTKYKRRNKGDDARVSDLKTAPAPWKGVVRRTGDAAIVHAGRFFRDSRLLVEAAIVWPARRDRALEAGLLESVRLADPDAETRVFQAMGLSVTCPASFDLVVSSSKVGQIQWDFALKARRKRRSVGEGAATPHTMLRVERIALAKYWLKDTALRDWLGEQAGDGRRLRSRVVPQNRHTAEEIVSVGRAPLVRRLGGEQRLQIDLAWRCEIERRIYHVQFTELRRDEEIALPKLWNVHCCRSSPASSASRTPG